MHSKFWYVAKNEYRKHVFRKKFLLAVFSVPLVLVVSILAGYLSQGMFNNNLPLGYVDMSGLLVDPIQVPEDIARDKAVEILPYASNEAADAALENGDIQAYYVIPPGYADSREVFLVYIDSPSDDAERDFTDFLQVNVAAGLPESVQTRILEGFDVTVRSMDGKREFSEAGIIGMLFPVIFGLLFTFMLSSGSGYLSNAVTEEKENRTIELLATSMSANQFIAGKVLGIVLVIFTQVASWVLFLVAAFFGARAMFDFDWLNSATFDLGTILLLLLLLVPAFFFVAGIALTISSSVTESTEGQQAVGIVTMPIAFSYWFSALIVSNPNSPLSVGLSLFPLTAPTIMPLRMAFGFVPSWEMAASIGILMVSAAFTIWLAARAYEMGMMQYGKRIRLGDLLRSNGNGK